MSTSVSDSDLDAVNAKLLPPQARRLVGLIGLVNTLKLLEVRGGVTLRIPVNASESAVLREGLPMDAIIKLCAAMPGQRLELPKCDKILVQIRNRAIQHERPHKSAPALALKYNLIPRHIISISKPAADDSQADLSDFFSEEPNNG